MSSLRYPKTLQSKKWLRKRYVVMNLNASEIARKVGCSVTSVISALDRFGIPRKNISEAKQGRLCPKRRVTLEKASRSTLYNRSREAINKRTKAQKGKPYLCRTAAHNLAGEVCQPSPCIVCGAKRTSVNHKDRNIQNNDPTNLERLCDVCHGRHHRLEEVLARKLLAKKLKRKDLPLVLRKVKGNGLIDLVDICTSKNRADLHRKVRAKVLRKVT